MKRKNKIGSEDWVKMQDVSKQLKIQHAPTTLVAGQQNIPLLQDVHSCFFANYFARHELIGIIDVTPDDVDKHSYYTLPTQNPITPRVALAYLLSDNSNFLIADNGSLFEDFLKRHPVVVYFPGCDDGNVARVFQDKQSAKEFVKNLTHFGELFEKSWSRKDIAALAKTEPQDQLDNVMKEYLFFIN